MSSCLTSKRTDVAFIAKAAAKLLLFFELYKYFFTNCHNIVDFYKFSHLSRDYYNE